MLRILAVRNKTRCCRYKWNISFQAHIHNAIECLAKMYLSIFLHPAPIFHHNNKCDRRKNRSGNKMIAKRNKTMKKGRKDATMKIERKQWQRRRRRRWWQRFRNSERTSTVFEFPKAFANANDTSWTWIDTYLKIMRMPRLWRSGSSGEQVRRRSTKDCHWRGASARKRKRKRVTDRRDDNKISYLRLFRVFQYYKVELKEKDDAKLVASGAYGNGEKAELSHAKWQKIAFTSFFAEFFFYFVYEFKERE